MSIFEPDNTFIFCFVRMNPPTPGHLILIADMINKAVELGVENAYIITSSSLDQKNPIPCSNKTIPDAAKTKADNLVLNNLRMSPDLIYKQFVLNKLIEAKKMELIRNEVDPEKRNKLEALNIHVVCSTRTPFGTINDLIKRHFIDRGITKVNLYFFVGRDRANFFDTIVNNYLYLLDKDGKPKPKTFIGSIDGECLGRPGMAEARDTGIGDTDISEMDPRKYSASLVRQLVIENNYTDFQKIYSAYLEPDEIEKLYKTIQIGIGLKLPPKKQENDYPPSNYFDVSINPEEDESKADPVTGHYNKIGLPTPYNDIPYNGELDKYPSGGNKRKRTTRKNRKTKRRKNKRHTRRYK